MSRFRHFVPATPRVKDFPFSFEVEELKDSTIESHVTTRFETHSTQDLMEEIAIALQKVFKFYKYLDKSSDYYLPKIKGDKDKEPVYIVDVEIIQKVKVPTKTTKRLEDIEEEITYKIEKKVTNTLKIKCFNFKSAYSFNLVRSVEQLKEILRGSKELSFDVETSGLDPEFDTIAGINFSTDKNENDGYYIPINHVAPYDQDNLTKEVFDVFYEAMVKADVVYMLNARFDIRNLEFLEYTYNENTHNIENIKYDMSKVNFIDTQILGYFADPDWKSTSMKFLESHFLGFYRLDLKDVMKLYGREDFDTTKLDPKNLLFYAAQDGITTIKLGRELYKYLEEFKISGQLDMEIIFPLMRMENRLIRIDTDYVTEELAKLDNRLEEIEAKIMESIGEEINLNSSQQKVKLFESFGLDTGVKTRGGNMSVSRQAVNDMIARMDATKETYPAFIKYLGEQSQLQQLRSTFFYSLAKQMNHRDGRIRLNYRLGSTATGRFSSGREEF